MTPSSDAIVGILSILLGFIFGEVSARLREAQTTRKQNLATRAMLRYEMSHNLERLQQRWQQLQVPAQPVDDKSRATYYAEELAEQPVTPFGREVYASQLPQFSSALSRDEVVATLRLYDDFEELDTIHALLARLQSEQRGYTSGAPFPTAQSAPRMMPATPFRDQAPTLWQTYQEIGARCLKQGVPIAA